VTLFEKEWKNMAQVQADRSQVALLLLLLLLLLTAIELSLGSSPYTSTDKTDKNKYT
jgi:hypothetical protein